MAQPPCIFHGQMLADPPDNVRCHSPKVCLRRAVFRIDNCQYARYLIQAGSQESNVVTEQACPGRGIVPLSHRELRLLGPTSSFGCERERKLFFSLFLFFFLSFSFFSFLTQWQHASCHRTSCVLVLSSAIRSK